MAKSLTAQIRSVWSASGIFQPGKSRYQSKQQARDMLRAAGVGATSARIAEHTPISSYRTYDAYVSVGADFARFASSLGVHRVADLRPEHVRNFLMAKFEGGASCNTLRTFAAALAKLDTAIANTPKKMRVRQEASLRPGIEAVRPIFNAKAPRLDIGRRAYIGPAAVVGLLQDEAQRIVAKLQLSGGFRISEVMYLDRSNLRGEAYDTVLSRPSGQIHVTGKGGYQRTQYVPVDDYNTLKTYIERNGPLKVAYRPYLEALKQACGEAGENWHGSHALRHNHIRNFIVCAAKSGTMNTAEVMREAMERVGHHRPSELATYCR